MAQNTRSKIIAELYVPAAQRTFEVRLPLDLRIHELVSLLSRLVAQTEPGSYGDTVPAVLCDRQSGAIFREEMTPRQLGWGNGVRLLLV